MKQGYSAPRLSSDEGLRLIAELLGEMATIQRSFENIAAAIIAVRETAESPPAEEDLN